MLNVTEL